MQLSLRFHTTHTPRWFGEIPWGFGDFFVRKLHVGVDETPAPSAMVPSPDLKLRACLSSTDSGNNPATRLHVSVRMSGVDVAISTLQSAG